jgi:hypothetical protein
MFHDEQKRKAALIWRGDPTRNPAFMRHPAYAEWMRRVTFVRSRIHVNEQKLGRASGVRKRVFESNLAARRQELRVLLQRGPSALGLTAAQARVSAGLAHARRQPSAPQNQPRRALGPRGVGPQVLAPRPARGYAPGVNDFPNAPPPEFGPYMPEPGARIADRPLPGSSGPRITMPPASSAEDQAPYLRDRAGGGGAEDEGVEDAGVEDGTAPEDGDSGVWRWVLGALALAGLGFALTRKKGAAAGGVGAAGSRSSGGSGVSPFAGTSGSLGSTSSSARLTNRGRSARRGARRAA